MNIPAIIAIPIRFVIITGFLVFVALAAVWTALRWFYDLVMDN